MDTWVARPKTDTHSRIARIDLRHRVLAAFIAVLFLLAAQPFVTSADAATGSISGTAFQDMNRDGVQQSSEDPFVDHLIFVFDSNGDWVASRRTNSEGRYSATNLPNGTYTVKYAPGEWSDLREDWVPTTTGSLYPEHPVTIEGDAVTADFGWRPIVKSTDINDPISEVEGPEGLRVQSYNDVIGAQELHDHLVSEFLIGDEAPSTTVRFAYGTYNTAQTTISQSDGEITSVRTAVYTSYGRWLDRGDRTLAHEYGHAWMNYHNFYVQQDVDREWVTYLEARGIDPDDDRLGSSHGWMPGEIAAEDYRLMFASENAASGGHMNRDIEDPRDIEGFEAWVRDEFTTTPGGDSDDGSSEEEDGAADEESGSDDGDSSDDSDEGDDEGDDSGASDDGSEESTSSVEADIQIAVDTYKVRGLNHADITWTGNSSSEVDVYRDGQRITTTNGATFTDETGSRGSPTYSYQVCEAGTDTCSEEVDVRF